MAANIQECQRWMLYALGGGLGHLTRAVALARAASSRDEMNRESIENKEPRLKLHLVTNSPFADGLPLADELGDHQRLTIISSKLDRDKTVKRVTDLLQAEPFDRLIVDTFPRGLGGELAGVLPSLKCQKVLIHRDLNPQYVDSANLSQFVNHFDLILVPGEPAPFAHSTRAVLTEPWLIRNDEELLPPTEARRKLNVTSQELPVVVVIGCGRQTEVAEMQQLAMRLSVEFRSKAIIRFVVPPAADALHSSLPQSSTLMAVSPWPFFETIRGVSVIVGGGGYNTVHEARASGTRLIGLSRPRLYDRQYRRLRNDETAADFADIRSKVAAAIESNVPFQPSLQIRYRNGVCEAVEAIESMSL